MRITLVDAFDSFINIIDQYFRECGCTTRVIRASSEDVANIAESNTDLLVLGPGPGAPSASGHVELVHRFAGRLPIFGICLGHQAIGRAYGASVARGRPRHGSTSEICHDASGAFRGLPAGISATRYHSLIVTEPLSTDQLVVTARSVDDGYIMGLRHRELPIESVQFHPESILTGFGMRIISNVLHLGTADTATFNPSTVLPAVTDRRVSRECELVP